MDDIDALHTAARAYVIERSRHSRSDGSWGSGLLGTLLDEIERSEPGDFHSLEETREHLVTIARSMKSARDYDPQRNPIRHRDETYEREHAVAYLLGLGPEELSAVEELPYRHTLADAEAEELRRRFVAAWSVDPSEYWNGAVAIDDHDVQELRSSRFFDLGGDEQSRQALLGRGITRVLKLYSEFPYQQEVDLAWMKWDDEAFWFDRDLDWFVGWGDYHPDIDGEVIAVGGWLLDELRSSWPAWHDAVLPELEPRRGWRKWFGR